MGTRKRYLEPSRTAASQTRFLGRSLVALGCVGYRSAYTLFLVAADTLPAAGDIHVDATSSSSSGGTSSSGPLPAPTVAPPASASPSRADVVITPEPSSTESRSPSPMANDTDVPSTVPPTLAVTPTPPGPTPSSSPSPSPTPALTPTPPPTTKTPAVSPPVVATPSPAPSTAAPLKTPSASPVAPVTSPAPSQQPSGSNGSTISTPTTSSSAPPSIPTPTLEKPDTPATPSVAPAPTAASSPAPSAQQSQAGSQSQSQPTVTAYNSTTLPPGVDSSVLGGGQLVRVETTATTQNGQTSISYTIVVKKGDQIETVQRGDVVNSNSTTTVDINHSAPTLAPSADSASSGDSITSQAYGGSAWTSSGVIIGLAVGALVAGLLIAIFVISRRRRRSSSPLDEFELNSRGERVPKRARADDGYSVLETIRTNSHDGRSPTTTTNEPPTSRHRSGSVWEDATIVAARIPFDKVEIQALVSRGGYGEVYRGVYRDQAVAVKKLLPETRKELSYIENFLREIKLAAAFEHPQIVTFIGVAWESLSDLIAISEFMEGGDLRSLLVSFNEVGSRSTGQGFSYGKVKIALHVAHALTYLHSLQPQVLHRDLKSRNILLTEKWDAKITDFGASRKMASSLASSANNRTMTAGVGSSLWMAPEVMLGRDYGDKADIFSLGVVLSELDTHELPYSHVHSRRTASRHCSSSSLSSSGSTPRSLPDTAILQMVSMGQLQVQFSRHCAPEMKQLAQQCVSVDPLERPSAAEVLCQLHMVLRKFEERR